MKKKFLTLLSVLCLIATAAYATTTHYSFILPVVGGSQNVWGTLQNSVSTAIDTQLWTNSGGLTVGLNSTTTSSNLALSNPIDNFINLSATTTGKHIALPPMNATSSPVPGGVIWIKNTGSNAFDVDAADGSTAVVSALGAGQTVAIQALTGSTTNGTFQSFGPFLTSVGTLSLGTTVTGASPSISGDATTGFWTAGAAKVDAAISGVNVTEWSANGEATTGTVSTSNALVVTATHAATATQNAIHSTTATNALCLETTGADGLCQTKGLRGNSAQHRSDFWCYTGLNRAHGSGQKRKIRCPAKGMKWKRTAAPRVVVST